jgi:hypothetical protein
MSHVAKFCGISKIFIKSSLFIMTVSVSMIPAANADPIKTDFLYIGDPGDPANRNDDTVKRFDAATGQFQGVVVDNLDGDAEATGGLNGGFLVPQGLIFDRSGKLDLANQNAGLPFNGAVLQFNVKTGKFLKTVVPPTDPHAPFAPRGIVLWDDKVLFVADFISDVQPDELPGPGRLLAFTKDGKFIAEFKPDEPLLSPNLFRPRGLVIGPDGLLYVSNFPNLATGLGGHVLRFNPKTGRFVDVFIADIGGEGHLNRPEGLVFGPDGGLYVTSFKADPNNTDETNDTDNTDDTDSIRIYNNKGKFVDRIDLDQENGPRASAQAILFGPHGFLFVPISGPTCDPSKPNSCGDTGAVRRYNVKNKKFRNFVEPFSAGGSLINPLYLTFGDTDPGTLAYDDEDRHGNRDEHGDKDRRGDD